MIRYKCPCGNVMESPASLAGLTEPCPACGMAVAVPSAPVIEDVPVGVAWTPTAPAAARSKAKPSRGHWAQFVFWCLFLAPAVTAMGSGIQVMQAGRADADAVRVLVISLLALCVPIGLLPLFIANGRGLRNENGVFILSLVALGGGALCVVAFLNVMVVALLGAAVLTALLWLAALIYACVAETVADGASREGGGDRFACVRCGEGIRYGARVCRFCGQEYKSCP